MRTEMQIKEKFELADGITILSCTGCDQRINVIGKKVRIVSGSEVRQILTLTGEREMLNQTANLDQKAFETGDIVELSPEEARSGKWSIVFE